MDTGNNEAQVKSKPVKLSLTSIAENVSCTIDDLLAHAEAGHVFVFARIAPHTATQKDTWGSIPQVYWRDGRPHSPMGITQRNAPTYSVLLVPEVALLRSGTDLIIEKLHLEGAENGFLSASNNTVVFDWLDEPQIVGIDSIFMNYPIPENAILNLPKFKYAASPIASGVIKLKKNTLIQKYKNQWRSAINDIAESSRNGLNLAQVEHGFYDEQKAVQWARERGKFIDVATHITSTNSILDSPTSVVNRST